MGVGSAQKQNLRWTMGKWLMNDSSTITVSRPLVIALLSILLGFICGCGDHAEQLSLQNGSLSLNGQQRYTEQGRALKAAIDKRYKALRAAHQVPGGRNPLDVSDIVSMYIRRDSSFVSAFAILEAAGCQINHTTPVPDGSGRLLGVRTLGSWGFGDFILSVSLWPEKAGDFSRVGRLEASIFYQSL